MNREEITLLGFEIVAYAGDARSKFLEALKVTSKTCERDTNSKPNKWRAHNKECAVNINGLTPIKSG